MATSPIYNWPEPDNTDLVKNGALAMRTLGDAIDTTMATMVPQTIVDAKGDLIAGTAADTASRLAVGANGETLVADSSTSTGLRYQGSMTAGKNAIVNGGFDIWQRGTSFTSINAFQANSADRWAAYRGSLVAGLNVSRQSTADTTNLPSIQHCARVQRASGDSSGQTLFFNNILESADSYRFAGRTVTLSFWARAGANFSATSNALGFNVQSGQGADQNPTFGFTNANNFLSSTANLTTTWTRFSATATAPAATTQLAILLQYAPTGTAGAADFFEITGVQLEVGSVATQFSRAGGTLQGELAACQRYYWRLSSNSTFVTYARGSAGSTTMSRLLLQTPVTMRTAPTAIETATASNYALSDAANAPVTVTSFTIGVASVNTVSFDANTASGLTQYRPYALFSYDTGNYYIGFSAEL